MHILLLFFTYITQVGVLQYALFVTQTVSGYITFHMENFSIQKLFDQFVEIYILQTSLNGISKEIIKFI